MNDQYSDTVQQITGKVQSLFYLVDVPTTMLTIQSDEQMITARAYGQLALELRALPRGATICATLHDAPPDRLEMIAFTVIFSGAGIPSI
jgi:hypothetical protein